MTPDQIIHARRVAVLEHAAVVGVGAACRAAGVSRTRYYEWLHKAEQYGLAALMPKDRRPSAQPNAMGPEEVSAILAEAVARPTLGARQLLDHLAARGVHRSASGVQKVLRRHNLGRRKQRLAALASITAAETGLVTDAAKDGGHGADLGGQRGQRPAQQPRGLRTDVGVTGQQVRRQRKARLGTCQAG